MHVTDALSELEAATASLGIPMWRRPTTPMYLDALQELLWPLRLPEELETFWRMVDVETLRVETYPDLMNPEWARTSWLMSRDDFIDDHPLALVEVGYASHGVMSVELEIDGRPGGAVYQWWVDDVGPLRRCFDGIGDWMAAIARRLYNGESESCAVAEGDPPFYRVHGDDWWPHDDDTADVNGEARPGALEKHISSWPAHWQDVNWARGTVTPETFPRRYR